MARPRKYRTDAERDAARREMMIGYRRASRARKRAAEGKIFDPDVPPPVEVIMERDHRNALYKPPEGPPAPYAANYYGKAWRQQRLFATGSYQ